MNITYCLSSFSNGIEFSKHTKWRVPLNISPFLQRGNFQAGFPNIWNKGITWPRRKRGWGNRSSTSSSKKLASFPDFSCSNGKTSQTWASLRRLPRKQVDWCRLPVSVTTKLIGTRYETETMTSKFDDNDRSAKFEFPSRLYANPNKTNINYK